MKLKIGSAFNLETEGIQELVLVGGGLVITGCLANKALNIVDTVAKRDDLPKIIQGVKDNVPKFPKQNLKLVK